MSKGYDIGLPQVPDRLVILVYMESLSPRSTTSATQEMEIHELRAQVEHLKTTIQLLHTGEEVGNHGVYQRDIQTNEVTWTDGLVTTIGMNADGLTGQNFMARLQERVHPDDMPIHFSMIKLIKKGLKISPFDYRVINDTGGYRWVRHGIIVHAGKAIIGTVQRIDEEKRQNRQIQMAKMVEKGEEVGQMGFCIFNIQTGDFEASPNLWRLHGIDPRGVEQKDFIKRSLEMVHIDDRHIAWNIQMLLKQSLPWPEPEYRVIHPNGAIRWLRFKWEYFKAPHQLIGTARDITEKKEEEVEKERKQYILRAGERVSQTASFIWNLHTQELIHTPQILEIYEFEDRENIDNFNLSERISDRLHPEDLQELNHIMEKLELGLKNINGDYRIVLPKGKIKWIRLRLGERINEQQVVGSVQDVTSIKEAEARMTQVNTDLEQMIATVSHDLRAPLRHVIAYADMLQKAASKWDPEEQIFVENIISSSQRLSKMIEQLLAYSRSRNIQMDPQWLNGEKIVTEIKRLFESETQARQIEWNIDPIPVIFGDKSMIENVFQNLFSNAVKFTQYKEHPTIHVHVEAADQEVIFKISDNGVGFDNQLKGKLFKVFQSLHKRSEFEGTGIGLANVSRIIKRHGGAISADGKIKEGAIFTFSLPLPPRT